MMKLQQVITRASKKHIRNIMRDTPFGQEKISFWAKWSTKYDVGGHHACQEICRRHQEWKGCQVGCRGSIRGARKVNV